MVSKMTLAELSLEYSKVWKIVHRWALFVQSIIIFQLEKFGGIMCHGTEEWCKLKEKLTSDLKNDIMNLVNFHAGSWKSEKLHFDRFLSSKAYKDLHEKVMSHDTEKWCKVWRKTEPWFQKMTWGIWWILMRAVESLKIYPFLDCFCRMCVIYELRNTEKPLRKKCPNTELFLIWIQ